MRTRRGIHLLLFLIVLPIAAQEPDRSIVRRVGSEIRRYGNDLLAMAGAPLKWDAAMWRRAGIVVAADAAAFGLDGEIGALVQRNRSSLTDDAARLFTPFGGRRALNLSGAVLIAGVIRDDSRLRESGRDAIEASILAGGIVTPLVKKAVGRSRPVAGEGPYAFDPLSSNRSFPSGHATNAFAVASVFAAHSEGWLVPTLAYTLATGVAVARVHDDAHYASDVLAGAAIGTAIGRSVVARRRQSASPRIAAGRISWNIMPVRNGVAVHVSVPVATLGKLNLTRRCAVP